MIRIMTAEERGGTTITVDGQLSGKTVEPVEACCIEALSRGKPVRLHLRDVAAIDDHGRATLRHLAAKGVDLTADGVYSSYVVNGIQSGGVSKRRCVQ